jgi:hypothetical protein
MMASRPYTTLRPESFCLAANGLLSVANEHDRDSLALLKLKPRNVSFTCDTGAEGMKRAVSFFRSHLGQTGKATVQILPPEEKKVVSTCISLELHLRHWGGEGFADSLLKRCSTAERRMGEACMSHVTPEPKIGLFNIAHFRAVAYTTAKTSPRMSPPEEITKIKVEIERLEQLCKDCGDSGIRKRIEAWIEAEKKKLEPEPSKR